MIIAHHLFDVIAGFPIADVLDGRFQGPLQGQGLPSPGRFRSGIVIGQDPIGVAFVILLEISQIGGAQADVHLRLGEAEGIEAGPAFLLGNGLSRGRHHLHQTDGAGT